MKYFSRLFIILSSICVMACSGGGPLKPPENLNVVFDTRTTGDGAELFDYKILNIQRSLKLAADKKARRDSGQTLNQRKRNIRREQDIKEAARRYLAYELLESQYCPHGYFIHSEVLLPDSYKVRGECRSPHQGSVALGDTKDD